MNLKYLVIILGISFLALLCALLLKTLRDHVEYSERFTWMQKPLKIIYSVLFIVSFPLITIVGTVYFVGATLVDLFSTLFKR